MKSICLMIVAALFAVSACERERKPPVLPDDVAPNIVPWALPAELEPLVLEKPTGPAPKLGEVFRAPECWASFERDGIVLPEFPFVDDAEAARHFASCRVEAYARLDDGARAVAWGTEPAADSQARDLRLAVWEPSGTLRWSATLDRSRHAANWNANFRSSYITVLPTTLCAGTLWEGDTQIFCLRAEDGESLFAGSLPVWSGIAPQSNSGGLVAADLSSLTQRYIFDGAEMRHKKLEALGGRAGYYATDGRRLYFAPSRVDAPPLIAYDLETFEEVWRTPLPSLPSPPVAHAWTRFNRVLLLLDELLVAVDTETGEVAWAYQTEANIGAVDADATTIYLLARRPELPNRLIALDPETGARRWSADTPSGTLRAGVIDGQLVIGSLRAVQTVTPGDE